METVFELIALSSDERRAARPGGRVRGMIFGRSTGESADKCVSGIGDYPIFDLTTFGPLLSFP